MTRRFVALWATLVLVAGVAPIVVAQSDPGAALRSDIADVDAAEVAGAVAAELAEPRYQLQRPWYEALQEFLSRMWVRLLELASSLADLVGGPVVLAIIIGAVVVGAAVVVTANLGRRRARLVDERIRREHEVARGLDPVELERRARTASDAGDHETAFRLAFRAALARLDRHGRITLRPGTTSGRLATQVDDPAFDRLIDRFDAVVYGGAGAAPADMQRVDEVLQKLVGSVRS